MSQSPYTFVGLSFSNLDEVPIFSIVKNEKMFCLFFLLLSEAKQYNTPKCIWLVFPDYFF